MQFQESATMIPLSVLLLTLEPWPRLTIALKKTHPKSKMPPFVWPLTLELWSRLTMALILLSS